MHAEEQDVSASHGSRQLEARLRAVASGRCAQHAALCFGLAALCDADGGPAYGLPPEVLSELPEAEGAVVEATGWWRLVAAVATHVVPLAFITGEPPDEGVAIDLASFGELLAISGGGSPIHDDVFSPAAEPPPALAAALDGGLLRCLELLMRRSGRAPDGPEAAVVRVLLRHSGGIDCFAFYLGPLLAYGEPRQAAALVTTTLKLLRTVDPQATVTGWAPWDSSYQSFMLAGEAVLHVAFCWRYGFEAGDMARGAALGAGPAPASQQLVRLLSYAAWELLPEMSRALMASQPFAPAPPLLTTLRWLSVLAARCACQPCMPSGTTPASGDHGGTDGGQAAEGDNGCWWDLLLEMGTVELLDAALKMVPRLFDLDNLEFVQYFLCRVVEACCSVAAVCTRPALTPEHAAVARSEDADVAVAAAITPGPVAEPFRHAVTAAPPGASTRPQLPWRPELLREAAAQLQSLEEPAVAQDAEGLAAYLERGGGGTYEAPPCGLLPLALALLPPVEARRVLPGRCANPACANLEGDSEVDLTLKACAGCSAVGYCCRPCKTAHWRAGHKEECGRVQGDTL
ncbi:hypothetical protein GPECTOR_18g32 [Gonium pectorale]|uniref:phytol kinase n=1 Tax=Gonium pectorale TaxID=33097 RepID=A0A150GJR7_GONPE|nr:hypothetical protein GPECTOR_18g32 [Gonium pectorale]|eukprot:KXZ50052.1 hypothetical protein GPECTOR_18g32 [Gonium pectorale]